MIVFKTWIIFEKQSLHHLHFTMCKCWHFYVVKKKQSKEKKGIFNFTQVLYRDSFIIWNRFSEYQAQTTLSLSELEILTTYKICNRYIVSMWVLSLSSRVWLCATPWNITFQASLAMGFPRQEYWSRLPFPSRLDLPNPETEPMSPASPPLVGGFFTHELPV